MDSLHDATAVLITLEPGDLAGLIRVRSGLETVAREPAVPTAGKVALTDAIARLTGVILHECSLESVLDEVGASIERAELAIEEGGATASRAASGMVLSRPAEPAQARQ